MMHEQSYPVRGPIAQRFGQMALPCAFGHISEVGRSQADAAIQLRRLDGGEFACPTTRNLLEHAGSNEVEKLNPAASSESDHVKESRSGRVDNGRWRASPMPLRTKTHEPT